MSDPDEEVSVESMDEEVSKILSCFSGGHLVVFWNLRDYPSDNLQLIYDNIVSALRKMSFGDPVELGMFGDKVDHVNRDLLKKETESFYVPFENSKFYWQPKEVGENVADWNMALNILTRAASPSTSRVRMLVISKLEPDSEVYRVLQILKSRNISVLVLDPPPNTTAESLFNSVDSIVACIKVFEGGSPSENDLYS